MEVEALTTGMLRAHSSPPNLQLIWRAIFCDTLRNFCWADIVLAFITWNGDMTEWVSDLRRLLPATELAFRCSTVSSQLHI